MEQWAKRWNALDDNGQNQFNERWRNERMLQKITTKQAAKAQLVEPEPEVADYSEFEDDEDISP